jgi:hypothetical protein
MNASNETELKIQSFITRLNSDLKDEKTYSIDSAIWYSTAYLNYTYAIYDSSLIYLKHDTTDFNIALNNNLVSESDLISAINDMVDSLAAFFDDVPTNPKHVIYCMAYEISVGIGGLDVGLVSVIGCGFSSVYYGSFGEEDYWYSIWDSGKCDEYHGTYVGQDATDQLEYHIMHPLVQNDPSWRIYTIPDETYTTGYIYPIDYPYTPAPRGHRGFIIEDENGSWEGPHCLSPDELNFYLGANGISYIIDDNKPAQQGFEFISIDVDGDVSFPEYGYYETHFFVISYGPKYRTTVPASNL